MADTATLRRRRVNDEAAALITEPLLAEELEEAGAHRRRLASADPSLLVQRLKEARMPLLNRRTHLAIVLAITLIAGASAHIAGADYLTGNPKSCALGGKPQTARYCAQHAALFTLKAAMARRTHRPAWDADITCAAAAAGLLKWRCTWKNGAGTGVATVAFHATSIGWRRSVVVTVSETATTAAS